MDDQTSLKYVLMDDRQLTEAAQLRSIPTPPGFFESSRRRLSVHEREKLIHELLLDDLMWDKIYKRAEG